MAEAKTNVNFFCQRCLQPIKIDSSFGNIGEHALASLSLPIHSMPEVDLESQAASLDHYISPLRLADSGNGANGFMLVGENETLSQNMKVMAGLFDILSGNSEIDHPLCEECTDSLLDLMDQRLSHTEKEWNDYNEFLKRLQSEKDEESLEDLEKKLDQLKREEEQLIQQLSSLQKQEKEMTQRIAKEQKEKERLDREADRCWKEYNKHRWQYMVLDDDCKSVECQLQYAQAHLDKLKKTNVFNATFHIWYTGPFGTINNFRLGRLPTAPVDWSEINAAWGQTALLLTSLSRKINLVFKSYKIVPYGNYSYIEDLNDHRELPLHGSGGFRFVWDSKFDAGMVAFLECLQQFKEEVEKGDNEFSLPYRMEKGKIEDPSNGNSYSIKIQFNSEEQWTRALKFMLTNLKWCIAWASSQCNK